MKFILPSNKSLSTMPFPILMSALMRLLLGLAIVFPLGNSVADTIEQRQAQLKKIQQQISQQNVDLTQAVRQRQQLQRLLKADETAIAQAAKAVTNTQSQVTQLNDELAKLKHKASTLQRLKTDQQATLAKQLESAYLSGSHDYLKMLLNQQESSEIGRLLTYYQYLNKARINAIEQLKLTLADIDSTEQEIQVQQGSLNQALERHQQQANDLKQEQTQRQHTLTALQATLNSKAQQLEQLQIEEASLKQIIEEAILAAKQVDHFAGLGHLRRKLKWPTQGSISEKFGQARQGHVRWKGVLMQAPEGQEVHSIAAGTVIYADWLKGYGMVIVIDHGKGYMSLYGHAQTLFKTAGDPVNQGETLALVGRSGGQAQPGLYFEIRHKGKAVNPALYCKG